MKAALHMPKAASTDKLVLIALANFASDDTCSCHPSLQEVADLVGYDRQTVFRSISSLEKSGLISKKSRGHGKVCEISLKIADKQLSKDQESSPKKVIGAVPVACVVVCKA